MISIGKYDEAAVKERQIFLSASASESENHAQLSKKKRKKMCIPEPVESDSKFIQLIKYEELFFTKIWE